MHTGCPGGAGSGSPRVESLSGREIVGVCKTWIEGGINAIEMYTGQASGSTELIVPLVYRKTANWQAYTGVIVQNLGTSDVHVEVRLYGENGAEITGAYFTDDIPPNSPHGYNTRYNGNAPSGAMGASGPNFVGSMRITSTTGQPLIGVVDVILENAANYYYNAIQR